MTRWAPTFAAAFPALHALIIRLPIMYTHGYSENLDLTPLTTLVNLQALALVECTFRPASLAALSHLPCLRKLDLTYNDDLGTAYIKSVAALSQLRELVLINRLQEDDSNLNLLTDLPHLQRLILGEEWNHADFDQGPLFSEFVSVTDLDISLSDRWFLHGDSLEELIRMPALKRLNVGLHFMAPHDFKSLHILQKARPDVYVITENQPPSYNLEPTLYEHSLGNDLPLLRGLFQRCNLE